MRNKSLIRIVVILILILSQSVILMIPGTSDAVLANCCPIQFVNVNPLYANVEPGGNNTMVLLCRADGYFFNLLFEENNLTGASMTFYAELSYNWSYNIYPETIDLIPGKAQYFSVHVEVPYGTSYNTECAITVYGNTTFYPINIVGRVSHYLIKGNSSPTDFLTGYTLVFTLHWLLKDNSQSAKT